MPATNFCAAVVPPLPSKIFITPPLMCFCITLEDMLILKTSNIEFLEMIKKIRFEKVFGNIFKYGQEDKKRMIKKQKTGLSKPPI